ncbi:lipocalin-like domain-containing protein [Variovorax sp. KK3]|uniref:lipocalin-like domain-containing protein n=1 Tax=Variovorax sp. KK3 TaxID=1855728 RepID=UPI00097BEA94|nr:lipocalin-like domain-containing protein [Variovorax sp. KK3]
MNTSDLIGTWFLREAYAVGAGGERLYDVYGAQPSGVIHYGSDGRMMALITHDGREPLDGDRQAAPEAQRAQAYKSSIAYAGRFTLEAGWVSHWVDVSTYANWVGTALRRALSFEKDTAVLKTAPQMQNGVETVIKLVWQREPAES